MSTDLESGLRAALAEFTDGPPPPGLAAAAIRTARRQRRTRLAVAGIAAVATLAAGQVAASTVGESLTPAASMGPLVVSGYSDSSDSSSEARSLLLDYATGDYVELPYRTLAVSPDGSRAVVETVVDAGPPFGRVARLGVLEVSTRELRLLPDTGRDPAWSPDGREILLTRDDAPTGFEIIDADSLWSPYVRHRFVRHRDIVDPKINVEGARYVWASGGQEIALTQSRWIQLPGERALVWGVRFYDRDGNLLRTIPTIGPLHSGQWFSPDGTRIAVPAEDVGLVQIVDSRTGRVYEEVPVPGWSRKDWGWLIGWAGDDHLVLRRPFPPGEARQVDHELVVVDLSGNVVQEVEPLRRWDGLYVSSSDGLAPAGAPYTFGVP